MTDSDATEVIKLRQTRELKKKMKHQSRPSKIWVPGMKSLLCVLALVLVLLNGNFSFYKKLDRIFFSVSSGLKGKSVYDKNIIKILLSPEDIDILKNSPVNQVDFIKLLDRMSKNKPLVSALFIDRYPDVSDNVYIKSLNENLVLLQEKNPKSTKKQFKRLIRLSEKGQSKMMMKAIKKSNLNIVLPVEKFSARDTYEINRLKINNYLSKKKGRDTALFDKLPQSALSQKMSDIVSFNTSGEMEIAPVTRKKGYGLWPLVWKSGDRISPDICTLMFAKILKDKPVWEPGQGVWFGFSLVATDMAGFIRPRYSAVEDIEIRTFTLSQAVSPKNSKIFKNSIVFIGADDDPSMESAIRTLMCIETGALSNTPENAFWLEKILIICCLLYLIIAVPKLRPSISFLVSFFILFLFLVVLIGMHLVKDWWFQLTLPMLFLSFGHIVMYLSLKRKENVDLLQLKTDTAFFKLGRFQYEQNRYEQAFESLKECRPKERVIELLYKLGISLERKRQYDLACSVFNFIDHARPGYNDVVERAERLSNMIFGRTSVNALSDGGTLEIGTTGLSRPVLGRYEIEKELGRGAMGIVYLGTDPKIGRKIAIKTMDFTRTFEGRFEEVKDRFFREAKAAGRLTHPNIVTIYDAGEEQDLAYIAMDFVDGITLHSCAKEDSLLPVHEVFEIIYQAADALDYAHKQNIIHRDIKPANIIYDKPKRNIVITDFGIARIADNTTTRPGIILGSPSFMSPEQLKGKEIDGRADIFSLGVTMYQLLTGKLPFKGTDLSSLGYQITSVKHISVRSARPDLPASAERIINKSLQKNPEKRYQSAGSMARILKSEIASMKS